MPWTRSVSGNPAGRPSSIAPGDSLAATIRRVFSREQRDIAIGKLTEIATTDRGIDPRTRIAAFECLARYGWPDEKAGTVGLRITGKGAQVVVQHVHLPIGISGQTALPDVVVDQPAYAGVKLGNARHIVDTAPVESPAQTPRAPAARAPAEHAQRRMSYRQTAGRCRGALTMSWYRTTIRHACRRPRDVPGVFHDR